MDCRRLGIAGYHERDRHRSERPVDPVCRIGRRVQVHGRRLPLDTGNELSGFTVSCVVVDPNNNRVLYAGTNGINAGGGIYRSSDAGTSWGPFNTGLSNSFLTSIAPSKSSYVYASSHAYYPQGILRSTDSGQTWLTCFEASSATVLVDPRAPAVVCAGSALRSTDAGTSWSVLNPPAAVPRLLAIDPSTSVLYGGGSALGGLYASTDMGASWTQRSTVAVLPHLLIDAGSSNTMYGAAQCGSFQKSLDSGVTWKVVATGFAGECIDGIAQDRITGGIYALSSPGQLLPSHVWRSIDVGSSWSDISEGLPPYSYVTVVAIDPAVPGTAWAGAYGSGVFRWTNGEPWTPENDGLLNTVVTALAFEETGRRLHAATFSGGAYYLDRSCTGPFSCRRFDGPVIGPAPVRR